MAWGCFSAIGRGYLDFLADGKKMDMAQYLDILRSRAQPAMAKLGANRILQDGAPCHRAKSVRAWLADKNWTVMSWPTNLSDLNPIEDIWLWIRNKIRTCHF